MDIKKIATVVAGIGALNWLLSANFNFDLVQKIGLYPQIVYSVVGVAGAYVLYEALVK